MHRLVPNISFHLLGLHFCYCFMEKKKKPHICARSSLRLPDVFGPYDSTSRHWRYQMWLRGMNSLFLFLLAFWICACNVTLLPINVLSTISVSDMHPIHIGPGMDEKKLSFVYAVHFFVSPFLYRPWSQFHSNTHTQVS